MNRVILATLILLTALNVLAAIRDQRITENAHAQELTWRQTEILKLRGRVHGCQDRLGLRRSPIAQHIVAGSPRYRRWVVIRWRERLGLCRALERKLSDPVQAILAVFGRHGWAAVSVARCESDYYPTDGKPDTVAHNGQYLGMFQMGSTERARYGHGSTPLAQARAAYAYFRDSGYDWSPWTCKP